MTYTSLSDVEEYFGTSFTEQTSPTLNQVSLYIADADEEINNITGTVFGTPVSKTEIIDIDGTTNMFLTEKYPIVSVTSVEKNTSTDIFTSDTWEAVDYINDRFRIITKYAYNGRRKLRFIYTYGYSSIPVEVKHLATLLVVNKIITGTASSNANTQSISVGPISIANSVGLNQISTIKNELTEYKRRVGRYKNFTR